VLMGVSCTSTYSPDGITATVTGGATHGMDLDGHYAYMCAEIADDNLPEGALDHEVVIVDAAPRASPG